MSGKPVYARFSLDEDGFTFENVRHESEEISHIFFSVTKTTHKINFAKVAVTESSQLQLTLKSGEKILLSIDEAGLFVGSKEEKSQELEYIWRIYQFLSERTFDSRMRKYLSQVEALGYFVYDECLFNPDKQMITFRNIDFPIDTSEFLRSPGYIEMKKKKASFSENLMRHISFSKIPQFNTQTDTDVIFVLLKQFFNLVWSN